MRVLNYRESGSVLRAIAFLTLRLTLLPLAIRLLFQKNKTTIIAYHAPTARVFETHVRILRRLYNLVPLSDFVAASRSGNIRSLPPRALIITIDDGHRSNFALQDVIVKHEVPVTIFVCSGIVGTRRRFWFMHDAASSAVQLLKGVPDADRLAALTRMGFEETKEFGDRQALSALELNELKASVDLESHTVLHPILPRCSPERAETEIKKSKRDLQRLLASEVYAFAYPNGEYSERELRFVEDAGYKCAVTLDRGFNSEKTAIFKLRRICIPDGAGRHELIVKVSGMWQAILAAATTLRRKRSSSYTAEPCGERRTSVVSG